MRQINILLKRNMIRFWKSKTRIFFTFLSPLFYLLIYFLFVKNTISRNAPTAEIGKIMADSYLLFGIVSVTTLTSALSICSIMMEDKENQVLPDLLITPTKSSHIRFAYVLSNFIINTVVSLFVFIIVIIYMAINKTLINPWTNYVAFIPLIVVSTLINALIFTLIVSFIKQRTIYTVLVSIVSSVIGFFIGAYTPWNIMPDFILQISSEFPQTQLTNIFKWLSLGSNEVYGPKFLPANEFILFGKEINIWQSIAYVGGFVAILAIINLTYKFKLQK
ncbi:ABC transporter permease [Mycoplasma sp. Mirounga ES2805-ORL]|uniref:ABC transporter permease n=1 Tax=Mycoplasma sp. Mirounga ES2805-ORL TaxID=754514 RepID=UPI00197C4CB1|nr:ABC transporter permease [Mycoplasma sp. Mirounga ES2805-ORL]QSF13399.1 ABC transporter permease [Mycoplasma sp. Mirounga ES2805-ORL]